MTESESTGTRPVLPRLGVPRRADLEDFDLAVHRAMDAHGCTWAEAFEVLRPVVPLAVRQGARFYCGSGESFGAPVTPLLPPQLNERLKQMLADLYEDDRDARHYPPPVLASLGDLELLLKLAFDPTVPVPPEAVTNNPVAPWAERFPTWGRRVRVTLDQAALLLANIDPVNVSHHVINAKIGNWSGWEDAESWAGAIGDAIKSGRLSQDLRNQYTNMKLDAIADAIKSGRFSPEADGEIAVADLLRWIDETTVPAPKPDAADFRLDSPDFIAEARAEALQAAQERDQARARADMLEQEKDALLGELEELRERLDEIERRQVIPNFVDVLNTGHPCHPRELEAALSAWQAVFGAGHKHDGTAPKKALDTWLKEHRPDLGGQARERITTVANPFKKGGAPSTPG